MINYYLITKPGIILGNLITVAAGFLLASKGKIDLSLFFTTLAGLALIIASACVFNNYIDRHRDQKMERTKNRTLARGALSTKSALTFATLLALCGTLVLFFYTNLVTVLMATVGFFVYVVLYSLWKGHTLYATAIGSIAGAIPPVVGYTAVSHQLDLGAALLFLLLILWQMPHFFAIALSRLDDYTAAGVPVLPVLRGVFRTKIHMLLYIICFILSLPLLTLFGYTGYLYLVVSLSLGLIWLALSIKGFNSLDDQLWGRSMFRLSIVVICCLSFVLSYDTL